MTNNKQQTAVSWFLDQLLKDGYIKRLPVLQLQQAKEMEKERIMDAFQDGKWDWSEHITNGIESKDPAQYYNETYGSNETIQ
jgi:hypothetical protein